MQLVQYSYAEYVMPFLFVHDIFLPVLKELFQEEKNPVRYVYGTVMSEWSSGRISCYKIKKPETIDKYLSKIIEEYNVTPVFTFTSRNMTKERLNNDFCNKVLDAAYSKIVILLLLLINFISILNQDIKMQKWFVRL